MPQTKFVTGKALALGLRPIVIVNKIDRSDARPDEVHTEIFDLFANLRATDEHARTKAEHERHEIEPADQRRRIRDRPPRRGRVAHRVEPHQDVRQPGSAEHQSETERQPVKQRHRGKGIRPDKTELALQVGYGGTIDSELPQYLVGPAYVPRATADLSFIALADGGYFVGTSFGAPCEKPVLGELVFNTSMTGYQEILTDPSYKGQIVTMTYPHIGNYGVNIEEIGRASCRERV